MHLGKEIWALDTGSFPWICKGYSHIPKKNNHENWTQVPSPGQFITIEATSTCVWAVDFDYHVYLYVKECDLPIRFQDYQFEFERWYPGRNWRPVARDNEPTAKKLSDNWNTDSRWQIDRNIDGVPTDKLGWQYATGFGSVFQPTKTATSYVRRKRLARYYTYSKMGMFAKITLASEDKTIKFLDIGAGGSLLPGSGGWPVCVWGTSKDGRIYFRANVSSINPEGDLWQEVEVCEPECCLCKVSVGPRGQIWGITKTGELITRTGIDTDNPIGKEWLHVGVSVNGIGNIYPVSVAVAEDAVWLVDSKGKVFFHKGAEIFVRNTLMLTNKDDERSISKWMPMIMDPGQEIEFKSLSCGPDNQVWAISRDDVVYNRTEITPDQIAGKIWQPIEDPKLKNKNYRETDSEEELVDIKPKKSVGKARRPTMRSTYKRTESRFSDVSVPVSLTSYDMQTLNKSTTNSLPSVYFPQQLDLASIPDSIEDEVANLQSPDEIFNDDQWESDEDEEEEEEDTQPDTSGVHYWKMISAGGCLGVGIRKDEMILKQAQLSKREISNIRECRSVILDLVREQSTRIRAAQFDHYETYLDEVGIKLRSDAKIEIEPGVWRGATVFLSKNIPHGHLRFRIFLPGAHHASDEDENRVLGRRGRMDRMEATVVINQTSTVEHVEQVPLLSIYGIKRISPNINQWTLLLYTAQKSYKIFFERSTDCNNWFDRVNDYVRAVHDIPNVPSNQSVWALSGDGTVYFSPPVPSCVQDHSRRPWLPIEGNFLQIAAGPRSVVWAVAPDNSLYYFTRGWGGGNHAMGLNLESFATQRQFQVTEHERYKMLDGFKPCVGRDRMPHWIDSSGTAIQSEKQYRLPVAAPWRWTSDWVVKNTDDSDKDGWLYAKNFHSPFSARPGIGARKRQQVRLAQMNIKAPWKKIPINLVKVARVAIEPYCFKKVDEPLAAWALEVNGSLLYRHGVTFNKPQGEEWEHVDIDHPLVDISVDAFCNLWAVCSDGSAYFRMGISLDRPCGIRWMHIVKPEKDTLVRISTGKYGVWALGSTGQCYIRTKISSMKEFGVKWELVPSDPMYSISVNGSDQVFGIRDSDKSIVSRNGITGETLKGTSWSLVLADIWSDVCITATSQHHHFDEVDEMTFSAMMRYRTSIWVKLREKRLVKNNWLEYHVHCPPIFSGDRVCIRGPDGMWSKNIIDHIGQDDQLKVLNPGFFTKSYHIVRDEDVIRDEPPHYTHLAPGTKILARLSVFTNKFSPCTVKSICLDKVSGTCWVTIKETGSRYNLNDIRYPTIQLTADLFFLDGKRRHSAANDEFGREIII